MIPRLLLLAAGLTTAVATASAQPAPQPARREVPKLVGCTAVTTIAPPAGFVDDPVASDGTRLAYVLASGEGKAELHVLTLATKQEEVVDLAPITHRPVALHLAGRRAFVVGRREDGKQVAGLIELAAHGHRPAGAVVYKLGPATNITVITRDGKPRVAVHDATTTAQGTRHVVELVALETGRRIAKGRPFVLDAGNTDKHLDFRVNHWSDGMTRAYGIKGGEWNRKEDQRSPDTEATYDLVTGRIVEHHAIGDLFEQRKRYQTLADAGGTLDFLRMTWNHTDVQIWHAGKPTTAALDQPVASYDPKSLQGVVEPDGSAWIVLEVDPVNPAAVARQKADPQYLDVFHAGPDGHAVRLARILATGLRHRFGAIDRDHFWLLQRSSGFDRGGPRLTVYQVTRAKP